jgi:glutamate racemase
LILGCTHYPLIAPLLQSVMGPGVRLVDSGAEAARVLAALLRERGMLASKPAEHRFYVSDQPRNFERIANAFLGRPIPPTTVVDQTDLPWFERVPPSAEPGASSRTA